jgi:predicted amidohydrolase
VDGEKVRNSHVVIDDKGDITAVYRKAHLFDLNIPERGIRLMESDYVLPGQVLLPPVETPVGKLGLTVVSFYEVLVLSTSVLTFYCL